MTIGLTIKEIRKDIGLSQKDFAQRLGVDQSHISKIEKGVAEPSQQLIKLICRVYDVNEKWLRDGEGISSLDPAVTLRDMFEFREQFEERSREAVLVHLDALTRIVDNMAGGFFQAQMGFKDVDKSKYEIIPLKEVPELKEAKDRIEKAFEYSKNSLELMKVGKRKEIKNEEE